MFPPSLASSMRRLPLPSSFCRPSRAAFLAVVRRGSPPRCVMSSGGGADQPVSVRASKQPRPARRAAPPAVRLTLLLFGNVAPRRAWSVAGGSRICSFRSGYFHPDLSVGRPARRVAADITVTEKLTIAVTFDPERGYVGTAPDLRQRWSR